MKRKIHLLFLLSCAALFSTSCTKNDDVGSYFHEGASYSKSTGLDAESKWLYDARDNELYPVVEFGGKYWMAENLRYEAEGAMLNADNPSKEYGCLYDWSLAKTACPAGWHLSSDTDWKDLEKALGMANTDLSMLGGRTLLNVSDLKAETGWNNGHNGLNTTLFSMLPAGRYTVGVFENIEDYAFFWTSTQDTENESIGRYVFHSSDQVTRTHVDHSIAQSCRCVLDY